MNYEDIVKKWQSPPMNDVEEIDLKLRNFRIQFAYHSCKIENKLIDYEDTREIFENGRVFNYTGEVRTLFEQQNQKDCYEMLKKPVLEKKPLSIDLIRSIHYELNKSTYDDCLYSKGQRPGEFIRDNEDIEYDLTELLNEINEYNGEKLLKAAAYLHARFVFIHPFIHGTRRTARTIMNYYLMVRNHPPLVIFEEDKRLYAKALEAYDSKEELEMMVGFLKNQFEKTWNVW